MPKRCAPCMRIHHVARRSVVLVSVVAAAVSVHVALAACLTFAVALRPRQHRRPEAVVHGRAMRPQQRARVCESAVSLCLRSLAGRGDGATREGLQTPDGRSQPRPAGSALGLVSFVRLRKIVV